jgi:hypothetical protein
VRARLVIAMMAVTASVSADVTIAGDGAPRGLSSCVAALQSALRARYPSDGDDESYCTLAATPTSATFQCHGPCTDRSCHNDACTRHDADLDLSLALRRADVSPWTRDARYRWQIRWARQYDAVRAELVQYGEEPRARVPASELRRLQRSIDACVDER